MTQGENEECDGAVHDCAPCGPACTLVRCAGCAVMIDPRDGEERCASCRDDCPACDHSPCACDDDTPEGWCGRVGPDRVVCSTCGSRKNPVGRSVAPEMHGCDWECPGYWEAPRPDQLWPREKCAPPFCTHAEGE